MPNPLVGISLHQRIWIVYFIITAIVLTIGTVIGLGVELNEIRVDKQQSGRVIYVGFLCAGGTSLLIGIGFVIVPLDRTALTKQQNRFSFNKSIFSNNIPKQKLLGNKTNNNVDDDNNNKNNNNSSRSSSITNEYETEKQISSEIEEEYTTIELNEMSE